MAEKTLVIVESPAKARTLKKHLGAGYEIEASVGHIRDLPKSRLGVDIDSNFEPEYIMVRGKGKVVNALRKQVKKSDRVLLASDPDREGEAIAWHLAQLLELDTEQALRIRMYEITKEAAREAVKEPTTLDGRKIDAQQARRVLDRVMGYSLSPLLWKKIKPGLSAGRVQSVGLRLIVEREKEINSFVPEEYWLLDALAHAGDGRRFTLRVAKKNGRNVKITNAGMAAEIADIVRKGPLVVVSSEKKETTRTPMPPFKTSTLQQEASRRLRFAPRKTMRIAQQLYEGLEIAGRGQQGLITYMRTDSLRLSPQALKAARAHISNSFGKDYLPSKTRVYASGKGAQDAHEAVRPTNVSLEPSAIRESLTNDQYRLYDLIWRRFVACQMASARISRHTVEAASGPYTLKQQGANLLFDGWGKVWPLELKEGEIPEAHEGEELAVDEVKQEQRFTKPPARYTESGLVKVLEEKGVGRPSTYASIIQTLYDRTYVQADEDRRMAPTELGTIVNDFVVQYFDGVINVDFTAAMENELDDVEAGERQWRAVVGDFWNPFSSTLKEAEEKAERVKLPVREIGEDCPECGAPLVIKHGRYGEFIACSAYPDCTYSRPILKTIGVTCPKCGEGDVVKRRSRKSKRTFYGCSRYPDCDFISWAQPTGERCEGGYMAIRKKSEGPVCLPFEAPRKTDSGADDESGGTEKQQTKGGGKSTAKKSTSRKKGTTKSAGSKGTKARETAAKSGGGKKRKSAAAAKGSKATTGSASRKTSEGGSDE
ncbi:MAG: type I DNA topoisomerase [Synergistales bacterium]|nr:type I DNA topoisomerase [Synergistales bacterium]